MLLIATLALPPACGPAQDTGTPPTSTETTTSTTATSSTTCPGAASPDIDPAAEWIVLDGLSDTTFSFADRVFDDAYQGTYGTYDLNTLEVYAANGFKLERPGQVVGVSVQWDNLPDEPVPATVWFWPDFGSNGYAFDIEHPYTSLTRCLDASSEGRWEDYALPEPIRVDQPLHVFAGYHRGEGEDAPEILMENFYQDTDPFWSGVRWPDFDDELYYLGLAAAMYTFRVRLAVVYDPEIPPEAKPFQVDPALAASSRVAWGDYDGDGDDDLMTSGPVLYRNDGGTVFTDVTAEALPPGLPGTNGGAWGDYDNDGCLDFFGTSGSTTDGDLLLHNRCDGTFEDATALSGIDDTQSEIDCDGDGAPEHAPTEAAAWLDFDGDGFLDLYQANYECWDLGAYYDDRLWRNRGDGTFEDATALASAADDNLAGRGLTTLDVEPDGDTDLFVANYRLVRNVFYENRDGELKDISGANHTQGNSTQGAYGHTIGAVAGDLDGDGDLDMVHANLAHPFYYHFSDKTMVLVNDGTGDFADEAADRGIYYRETHSSPVLLDAENDGDLDLFITSVYATRDSDFYLNDGTGHFTLANHESGLVVQNGWGAAAADPDQDGDLDVVAYDFFRNRWSEVDPAAVGHFLEVTLVGGAGAGGRVNRSAIGATVTVQAGGRTFIRQVSGGSGTGCQDSLTLHFGLGDAAPEALEVLWPGGATTTLSTVPVDGRLWIHEDGRTTEGWSPPDWAGPVAPLP